MANYSEFQAANSQRQDEPASNDGGQLDTAGQAILKLLHKAAGVAEANSRHGLETDGPKAVTATSRGGKSHRRARGGASPVL